MSGHGVRNPELRNPATLHPTTLDIAWAAGIFEGEGHARLNRSKIGKTQQVVVGQKEPWLCERLKALFGGTLYQRTPQTTDIRGKLYSNVCWVWQCSGARARGFLMTIYKFLSPHKKQQVRKALEVTTE